MSNQKSVTTLDDAPAKAAAPAAGSPEATVAAELIKHNKELSGERRILTIHASGEAGGNNFVFIGLNGVGYQVPRGRPFNVPAELVENLKNAEYRFYERNDQTGEQIVRDAPRFAYTVEPAPAARA